MSLTSMQEVTGLGGRNLVIQPINERSRYRASKDIYSTVSPGESLQPLDQHFESIDIAKMMQLTLNQKNQGRWQNLFDSNKNDTQQRMNKKMGQTRRGSHQPSFNTILEEKQDKEYETAPFSRKLAREEEHLP